jgi:hypothetical protein
MKPNEAYIAAYQEAEGWRAYLMVNHPTPSGCDRWMPHTSTSVYQESRREAEMLLSGVFDAVPIFDPETQTYWGGFV